MGCGCKNNGLKTKDPVVRENSKFDWSVDGNVVAKWTTFVVLSILSPLMIPFIIVAMYFAIIKNKRLDVLQTLRILLRTAIDMRNKKQDALEELDLDNAKVFENIVESVVKENV
tara:strand:+ start:24406 stop:24747 length:342 start_codon:yes stop_codon:yes gene_type:complete